MDRRRPGVLGGLLIAAMLTAVLTGILFFAWRVAGLPFVPFDTFDWLTRALPGRLIAFGICTMLSVIRLWDLGPISSIANSSSRFTTQVRAIGRATTSGPAIDLRFYIPVTSRAYLQRNRDGYICHFVRPHWRLPIRTDKVAEQAHQQADGGVVRSVF